MTNDFIINCLKRQDSGCNYDLLRVEEISGENAAFVEFDFCGEAAGTSVAVVYGDGTTFTLSDWQGGRPESPAEIDEFDWRDLEHGTSGVNLLGLPRSFSDTPAPSPVTRKLYPTKAAALAALRESGKGGYKSSADDRSNLDVADGFAPDFSWSGEVEAMRTDDGDIFAWWE